MNRLAMIPALLGAALCGCGTQTVADWTFAQDGDGPGAVYDIREVARGQRYVLTCPADGMGLTICDDLAREQCGGAYRVLATDAVPGDGAEAVYALDIACGGADARRGRRSGHAGHE